MSGVRSSRNLLEAPMVIRMVLAVWKHLKITHMIILDNFVLKTFSKNQSLGMSRLRSSRNLLEAPRVIRMVLAIWKLDQITNMIILENFGLKNCHKKINPMGCQGSGPPGTCWRLPWR